MIRFSVLGSGSRGNAVYVESGTTAILVDGGFSGKEIEKRLKSIGRDLDSLDGVCVTHEHNDHIHGVGVISRRCRIPVLANAGTFKGGEKKMGKLFKRIEFETGGGLSFHDLFIRSFRISHDTADPVGFVISDGQVSLGYCTDTGKVTFLMEKRLSECNGLILEFNHNPEMLKNGPYPLALQQRVRSTQGHLSNEKGAEFLKNTFHDRLHKIVLAHLSETNNRPELALYAAEKSISDDHDPEIVVASQDIPTPLLSLL
ncbi:metallo-hydrolase [Desulfomarina profundi]|uniref:Metallo-hydrolase n=1 Tax=Desulfomarina profundi TaxID=2772557 RepID=A0A8D5FWI3_9BACT|nr:MBL fold metallo-hydrolase [Desulfomarina profundi]BCL61217.1 metallo-hydrolase [Desulfomarina profundi]